MFTLLCAAAFGVAVFASLDLLGRQFFQQDQETREHADAKSRYIAAISHDFGTPIALLDMLFDRLGPDRVVSDCALRRMRAALKVLSAVRRKAIDLNKLEHCHLLQPERVSCRVSEIVAEAELVAGETMVRPSVRLIVDVSSAPRETILTDPGSLLLILLNFLSNAFKHVHTTA